MASTHSETIGFDPRGGTLGVTPILWRFRMQYGCDDSLAEEYPDWDQCCTCWVFAVSEGEARSRVWAKFDHPGTVRPDTIESCTPERFENERDRELAARFSPTPTGEGG